MVRYHTAEAAGHKIFYREAGDRSAPAVLLLHGFPTSSHMFRNLIPRLAEHYRVVAPDLPGFGFSLAPEHGPFRHTFDDLVCRLLLEKKKRRAEDRRSQVDVGERVLRVLASVAAAGEER